MQTSINTRFPFPPAGNISSGLPPYIAYLDFNVTASTKSAPQRESVGARGFVWTHLGIESTEQFLIEIRDEGAGENFQKSQILTRSLTGDELIPLKLPVPWMFKPNSQIQVIAENLSGSDDRIRVSLIGFAVPENLLGQIDPIVRRQRLLPYLISVFDADVAANTTSLTTPSVVVGPRAFIWRKTGLYAPTADFKIFLRDTESGEAFMRNRVDVFSLRGNQGLPADFGNWRFNPNSSVEALVENITGSQDRLTVTMIGYVDRDSGIF